MAGRPSKQWKYLSRANDKQFRAWISLFNNAWIVSGIRENYHMATLCQIVRSPTSAATAKQVGALDYQGRVGRWRLAKRLVCG